MTQVSLPGSLFTDTWIISDSIDTKYQAFLDARVLSIGVCLVLILVPRQAAFTWGTGGWRWPVGITYKYFSPLPLLRPTLLPFHRSVLSLSRSPRAIHQRKSTGVLAFPFFGCSNELAGLLVTSPFSLLHHSFRLCPPLFLSWPVNLPFSSSRSVYDWDFIAGTASACSVSQCENIYLTYSFKSRDHLTQLNLMIFR